MLPQRQLGAHGPRVAALGLGCMGMTSFYGPGDREESVATIQRAIDLGVTLFDTADVYNEHMSNEELVGAALAGRRDQVILATKFGHTYERRPDGRRLDGRAEYVRWACEASLRRLDTDYIDLYYLHRPDPAVPIEETIGAMAGLVAEGKIRYVGLSEVTAQTLRRAQRVHPIAAVQTEYSLWTRDVEDEILPACRELGVGFVPYSPLGRGFLAERFTSLDELSEDDWRREVPRFQGENLRRNLDLRAEFNQIAAGLGCRPAQLALAWVLARGDDLVPIPGTRRRGYLEENLAAAAVRLSAADLARLDGLFPPGAAAGARYPDYAMAWVDQNTSDAPPQP
ncbi:MAG TPA: aldo/keto reductase [Herpetosiphonaceae bacterium]|nr:aldo/keto reductase [Herpetosiphonaceae bacterium]